MLTSHGTLQIPCDVRQTCTVLSSLFIHMTICFALLQTECRSRCTRPTSTRRPSPSSCPDCRPRSTSPWTRPRSRSAPCCCESPHKLAHKGPLCSDFVVKRKVKNQRSFLSYIRVSQSDWVCFPERRNATQPGAVE